MNRRMIAIVLSVVLAVAGTVGVAVYVRNADQRALAGQAAQGVYITQKLVPAGTKFKDAVDQGLMTRQMVAAKGVPSDPLPTLDSNNGSTVAVSAIQPGEIVLASRFGAQAAATSALAIPPGQMAVSVALGDPARVADFVTPGSQIAVFDTFNVHLICTGTIPAGLQSLLASLKCSPRGSLVPSGDHLTDAFSNVRATRVLLPRVTVLAVGATTTTGAQSSTQSGSQTSGNQTSTGTSAPATALLTIAVTQAQAQELIQGTQTGTLYLALLTSSSTVTPGAGVNDLTLFNGK